MSVSQDVFMKAVFNNWLICAPLTEREFDPDIYCGVIDVETKKPCTRSLTCKVGCLNQNKIL